MKLIDLNPRWVGAGGKGISRDGQPVPERCGIGVSFDCPCGCRDRVYVGFINPLDGGPPYEGITWQRTGEDFETLTLQPSILRGDGCRWHGFVIEGRIITC